MFCKNPYQKKGTYQLFPCGKCSICLVRRRETWSTRMLLEFLSSGCKALFVTLTYDDHNLKDLNKRDCQLFLKRLRKKVTFRYFLASEYGDISGRPHYHAVLFGLDENSLQLIDSSWQHGFVSGRNADFASIRYTASYCVKKMGDHNKTWILSSRRPGLGVPALENLTGFLDSSGTDVVDFIQFEGKKLYLPSFIKDKLRKLIFSESHIKELKQCILEEQFERNLEASSRFFHGWAAYDNLKKGVLAANQQSNKHFDSLQSIFRRKQI